MKMIYLDELTVFTMKTINLNNYPTYQDKNYIPKYASLTESSVNKSLAFASNFILPVSTI